ncbi:MAG TPA: alanyl-tRNA editing protein [Candidatus Thalassarchaeaceae archaeon]|jgi:misacylated tRNA(Ala) deacylase|nr:alanyl-tRNA editing protein [Candidatus Thalassarchaeaceae archaeon]|tara:strand:+ start:163 stop:867 length:705 start_codon:yes stop_codon:yes gene_type:complete
MNSHPGTNPPPFRTRVVAKKEDSLLLEETHCYPRGGGQPGDTGVIYVDDGPSSLMNEVLSSEMILHPVDEVDIFNIDQEVTCEIDLERRNGHTMMHTAQHIFSALAEDLWGSETVGNQIGADHSRVDLLFEDKAVFNPVELIEAVNSVLSSNVPVNVHKWDREKILSHELMRHTKFMHRIPQSITHLRVVEVEDVDLCPCAGTHVSNTSQIPKVKYIGKKNKGKGRLRVSYEFE